MILLAYCLRRNDRPADALTLLKQLLKLDPDDARANYEAAQSHFELGQLQQAKRSIEAAIKAEPDNPEFEAAQQKFEQEPPNAS